MNLRDFALLLCSCTTHPLMFNGDGEPKPSRPTHFMMLTGINERDVVKLDHPLFIKDK